MRHKVLLHDAERQEWLSFQSPLDTITAYQTDQVRPALQQIEACVAQEGLYAAGFLSYESAPAFDPACVIHSSPDLPLLHFGIYRTAEVVDMPDAPTETIPLAWEPEWDLDKFSLAIADIHEAIANGETYQVNLTFPLHTPFHGSPWDFFCHLSRGQNGGYQAYIDLGRYIICSASPELFFRRDTNRLVMRPMKGTLARGLSSAEDLLQARQLRTSAKDRAENIMILDMVRNDLGRLADPGKVRTTGLCDLEKYATVWQMTSTVEADTSASFDQIMAALFPCASITGAPKYRTMEIIARLEQRPRGIYTGSIGYLAPQGHSQFSVGIRTAVIDRQMKHAHYGVGAGITWDSDPATEYRECLDKARILSRAVPVFDLLETFLWDPKGDYLLLDEHLLRLMNSAEYFDYPCDPDLVRHYLRELSRAMPAEQQRVRLLLSANGQLRHEVSPFVHDGPAPLQLRLANRPTERSNPFIYHKTTIRTHYEQARLGLSDCDDVVLWNDEGEVTETTIANIVVDLDGNLVTPPVGSGLLPGTFRGHLLARGDIVEKIVRLEDLPRCRQIYLINALRGWRSAIITDDNG